MNKIKFSLPGDLNNCPIPWQNMIQYLSSKVTEEQWDSIADKKIDEEMETCKGRIIRTDESLCRYWVVEFSNEYDYMQWFLKWG